MRRSPYREPGIAAELDPPAEKAPADDFAVAVVLLLAGVLGLAIGVAADEALGVIVGLAMIALGVLSRPKRTTPI